MNATSLQSIIEEYESFKNSYFWTPPTSASGRRSFEKYKSFDETFTIGGKLYRVAVGVTCSCKNVYVNKTVEIDGKRTTIATIKNLVKRMTK